MDLDYRTKFYEMIRHLNYWVNLFHILGTITPLVLSYFTFHWIICLNFLFKSYYITQWSCFYKTRLLRPRSCTLRKYLTDIIDNNPLELSQYILSLHYFFSGIMFVNYKQKKCILYANMNQEIKGIIPWIQIKLKLNF